MTRATRSARRIGRVVGHLLLVLLVAGWWTYLRPEALGGGTSFIMVSGESMEPTYETGDLVLVRKRDAYEVGDVVAYRTSDDDSGLLVIHRVVDVLPDGRLVLQGDNNDFVDPWNPTPGEVAGERFLELRGWGMVLGTFVRSPLLLGAVFGGVATTLVMLGRPPRRKLDDADTAEPEPAPVPEPAPPRRRLARLFVCWLAVGVIAAVGSSAPGSASQLDVDGGVLQIFEPTP